MTENSPASPQQPVPPPMQIGVQTQYIKDLSFESPNAPHIFAPTQAAPELKMDFNITTRRMNDNTMHEVALLLRLEVKIGDKVALIAELTYAGLFMLPSMPEEQLKFLLLVECPRLLFPFARAILANAIRDGGFPQFLIHPIDFGAIYEANKGNLGQSAVAGTA
jgi:preprotein translocase subunit SecB